MKTTDPWVEQQFEEQIAALIEQRRTSAPAGCGWADYEIRAVRGEGELLNAIYALGFNSEHFGMQDSQAVSCKVCGGLFLQRLSMMRRHRLRCGWTP